MASAKAPGGTPGKHLRASMSHCTGGNCTTPKPTTSESNTTTRAQRHRSFPGREQFRRLGNASGRGMLFGFAQFLAGERTETRRKGGFQFFRSVGRDQAGRVEAPQSPSGARPAPKGFKSATVIAVSPNTSRQACSTDWAQLRRSGGCRKTFKAFSFIGVKLLDLGQHHHSRTGSRGRKSAPFLQFAPTDVGGYELLQLAHGRFTG